MLTDDRLEEIRRYCHGGIPLPAYMQRDLLNEIDRLRATKMEIVNAISKKICPPAPHDVCSAGDPGPETCMRHWTEYINGLIGPKEASHE